MNNSIRPNTNLKELLHALARAVVTELGHEYSELSHLLRSSCPVNKAPLGLFRIESTETVGLVQSAHSVLVQAQLTLSHDGSRVTALISRQQRVRDLPEISLDLADPESTDQLKEFCRTNLAGL